jgi:4-amino-4-deoxy-L-arabinose transferase-like glycosyltransferase
MFHTYFNNPQLVLLILAFAFIALSGIFKVLDKYKWAILSLFVASLAINFFAGISDPYINLWDERFHALVAKNMLLHPFQPMLYNDPVVDMDYNSWVISHIWLHKPPLFTWQIALSFKIFGVNELALRLPSIIMASLLVFAVYRMGKLTVNKSTGYYAALIMITSFFLIELVSGQRGIDHNDVSFLFYVTTSIWAWIEYSYSGKNKWIYIIGLFAGAAVLCKWLTGLLVFFIWFIDLIQRKDERTNFGNWKALIISILICLAVFVPWQVYILIRFPENAFKAYAFFSKHITEPLDGHSGIFFFHINNLGVLYGQIVPYLILLGIYLYFVKVKESSVKISLLLGLFVVYLFFAIAKTKMESHVYFASSIIFLCLASILDTFILKVKQLSKRLFISGFIEFFVILLLAFSNLKTESLQANHTTWSILKKYIPEMLHNKEVYLKLKKTLPENAVIFNVRGYHYIEAMFYSSLPAYYFIPDKHQYEDLVKKHRIIAVIKADSLPDYLLNAPNVIILNEEIKHAGD